MKRIVLSVCAAVAAAVSAQGETYIAHWPFTDGSLEDTSGNGYSLTSGASVVTSDGYLHFPENAEEGTSWAQTTNKVTMSGAKTASVSFWLRKPNPANGTTLMELTDMSVADKSKAGSFLLGYTTDRQVCLTYYAAASAYLNTRVSSAGRFDDDEWHFVAATINITSANANPPVNLYVDGKLDSTATANAKTKATTSDTFKNDKFYFARRKGSAGTGGSFAGDMDEIAVYGRVLNAANVQTNYYRQLGIVYGGDSAKYQSRLPDGYRVDAQGVLSYRIRVISAGGVKLDEGEFKCGTNDYWLAENTPCVFSAQCSDPAECVAWSGAPAFADFPDGGRRVSFAVVEPETIVVDVFAPTHVWTGAASTDFKTDGNWADASGAETAAPGPDARVFIPVGAPNQPTAQKAISVGELRIGRLTNDTRTATFTSETTAMHQIAGSLVVYKGGKMTHTALLSTDTKISQERYKLNLSVGEVTVMKDGRIDVTGRGFSATKGPGVVTVNLAGGSIRSLAMHGGTYYDGKSYGSLAAPTNCGSGAKIGNGGGAIRIEASGDICIWGEVHANSSDESKASYTTGSGGSVWLTAKRLLGNGQITASAGTCTYGGAGCGGRISIRQTEATDFSAWKGIWMAAGGRRTGGSSTLVGGPGTICLRSAGESASDVTVIVDNDNYTSTGDHSNGFAELGASSGCDAIGTLIVRNKGFAKIVPGTEMKISGGIDTTGGFTLVTNAVVRLCGNAEAKIAGSQPYENFVCEVPGKTISFGTAETDCFEIRQGGALTLRGTEENMINLRPDSATPTNQWPMIMNLDVVGDIAYASVSNSNASAGEKTVTAVSSADMGGNVKWSFIKPINPNEEIVWTGKTSDDWNDVSNWKPSRAVVATDDVIIPTNVEGVAVVRMPTIVGGSHLFNRLTVKDGATLTLDGSNIDVTNALVVAGTLQALNLEHVTCSGSVSFEGGTFLAGNSTFRLEGDAEQSVNLDGLSFHHLEIEKPTGSVAFAEGWTAAVFECRGTEDLTVIFAGGKAYQVTDLCLFFGTCDDNGKRTLTLRSSDANTAWQLRILGRQSISGVDVQRSQATGGRAIADSSCADSGHNVNWDFGGETEVVNAVWLGTANGDFANPNNWSTLKVPDDHTRVFVFAREGESKSVTASTAISMRDLVLESRPFGKVTFKASKSMSVVENFDVGTNTTVYLDDPAGNRVGGNVVMRSGALMTHTELSSSATTLADASYKLNLSVDGDMTLAKGAVINVSAKGYPLTKGPGSGGVGGTNQRPGASHGGLAGMSLDCYGSVYSPFTCGSGGKNSVGGGAVRLTVGGHLTLGGEVLAKAQDTTSYTSGAGGSIWIDCGSLAGDGFLSARGGSAVYTWGSGGGRVALYVRHDDSFTGRIEAGGGYASSSNAGGGAGTIYRQSPGQADGCGTLTVDNSFFVDNRPASLSNYGTELPMADDVQAKGRKAYAKTALVVRKGGRVLVKESMTIADIDLQTSDSQLDLGTNTLTVSTFAHKHGRNWAVGAKVTCTTNAATGVYGKIVWPSGFALIVR